MNDTFVNVSDLPEKEPAPGFRGRFVHSAQMTVAHWRATKGARIPPHRHVHEMIVNVLDGRLELTVGDEIKTMGPGDIAVIPSQVQHEARALTDCWILDAFHPVREDYR
jgi:quercetin dioxygenase-like cupin family protein